MESRPDHPHGSHLAAGSHVCSRARLVPSPPRHHHHNRASIAPAPPPPQPRHRLFRGPLRFGRRPTSKARYDLLTYPPSLESNPNPNPPSSLSLTRTSLESQMTRRTRWSPSSTRVTRPSSRPPPSTGRIFTLASSSYNPSPSPSPSPPKPEPEPEPLLQPLLQPRRTQGQRRVGQAINGDGL